MPPLHIMGYNVIRNQKKTTEVGSCLHEPIMYTFTGILQQLTNFEVHAQQLWQRTILREFKAKGLSLGSYKGLP